MSDLIDRQDAIDAMCKLMNSWFGGDPKDEREEIKWIINHLPSAQPDNRIEIIADIVEGTIDHLDRDDAMDMLYQIKEVLK